MGLGRVVKYFSVGFNLIDTNGILDIHKYLMKITWLFMFIMFVLTKKKFWVINGSNHTKCVLLSNQKCLMTQLTLISLHD